MRSEMNTLNVEQARFNMVEQQVRPWDVLDAQTLRILSAVKRENFVPPAHKALAFGDVRIPLGASASQVMLEPRVQARMLQDLQIKPTDRVLDIGTGSGFMAAMLAAAAHQVVTVDIDANLANAAQKKLLEAGLGNVQVCIADASLDLAAQGVPAQAESFDAICVSGALHDVPEHLKALLADGGRLIAVMGTEPMAQATLLTRVVTSAKTAWRTEVLWDTVLPPLEGFKKPNAFRF